MFFGFLKSFRGKSAETFFKKLYFKSEDTFFFSKDVREDAKDVPQKENFVFCATKYSIFQVENVIIKKKINRTKTLTVSIFLRKQFLNS